MNQQQVDEAIIRMNNQGISQRQIAINLAVGRNRIREVIRAALNGSTVEHNVGGKIKLSPSVMAEIEAITRTNGNLSDERVAVMVSQKFNITLSRSSVNVARKKMKFRYLPKKTIQALTREQIGSRIQFAMDYLSDSFTKAPLVFSDESRFELSSSSGWVWRRRAQYDEEIFHTKEKFNKSIMVWGAIGLGVKSDLVIFSETVNNRNYSNAVLGSHILERANTKYGKKCFYYMHDGASCHTSATTIDSLSSEINIFPGWPPNSPDLNPIESLWGYLKRRLKWSNSSTIEEGKALLLQAWEDIPQDVIDGLVQSFDGRVGLMHLCGGGSIQPLVSSNIRELPIGYGLARDIGYIPWSTVEDDLIMSQVAIHGTKWKVIAIQFPNRSSISIKQRWNYLRMKLKVRIPGSLDPSLLNEEGWPAFADLV